MTELLSGWNETVSSQSGSPRWCRNMWPHKPKEPHVWLCVGNDDGNVGDRMAVWGGSTLDAIDWRFGGWAVHERPRALEIGDLIYDVFSAQPRTVGLSWPSNETPRTTLGDFHLMVDARRALLSGRHVSGIYEGYVPKGHEEVLFLWRWWIGLKYPEGGLPWCMNSSYAFRDPEEAKAYAEGVAQALVSVGFGLEEALAR